MRSYRHDEILDDANYFRRHNEKVLIEGLDGDGMVGWIRHVGDTHLTVEREWHSTDKFPIANVLRMGSR